MNKLTEQFFTTSTNVFTQTDVVATMNGSDFSRHGLVKRAMSAGEILNICRGLYCLAPKYQKKPVRVYSLAERIYGPSYVSLESALSYHGWIPEAVYACVCVSYHTARQFETPLGIFNYKRVPQGTFYSNVERCKDENGNVFLMASPAKALVDYVYIHRLNWRSIDDATESLRIEADDLAHIGGQELRELLENYTNGRVRRFLTGWLKKVQS